MILPHLETILIDQTGSLNLRQKRALIILFDCLKFYELYPGNTYTYKKESIKTNLTLPDIHKEQFISYLKAYKLITEKNELTRLGKLIYDLLVLNNPNVKYINKILCKEINAFTLPFLICLISDYKDNNNINYQYYSHSNVSFLDIYQEFNIPKGTLRNLLTFSEKIGFGNIVDCSKFKLAINRYSFTQADFAKHPEIALSHLIYVLEIKEKNYILTELKDLWVKCFGYKYERLTN